MCPAMLLGSLALPLVLAVCVGEIVIRPMSPDNRVATDGELQGESDRRALPA